MKLIREDTVKTNSGKWTNRGKEGTHGTFSTKKKADAQRRAMFANGFTEDIDEDEYESVRGRMIEFPNGEYVYIDKKGDKLIAGSTTNRGIIPEYEVDIDYDFDVDWNLQNLYDTIVEERPELLDESYKEIKKNTQFTKLVESITALRKEVSELKSIVLNNRGGMVISKPIAENVSQPQISQNNNESMLAQIQQVVQQSGLGMTMKEQLAQRSNSQSQTANLENAVQSNTVDCSCQMQSSSYDDSIDGLENFA